MYPKKANNNKSIKKPEIKTSIVKNYSNDSEEDIIIKKVSNAFSNLISDSESDSNSDSELPVVKKEEKFLNVVDSNVKKEKNNNIKINKKENKKKDNNRNIIDEGKSNLFVEDVELIVDGKILIHESKIVINTESHISICGNNGMGMLHVA